MKFQNSHLFVREKEKERGREREKQKKPGDTEYLVCPRLTCSNLCV